MSYLRNLRNIVVMNLTAEVPALEIDGPLAGDVEKVKQGLGRRLAEKILREPAAASQASYGWVPPITTYRPPRTVAELEGPTLEEQLGELRDEHHRNLVEVVSGRYLVMCYSELKREVSGNGLKRMLQNRIAEIEEKELRKVYKKEREQLRSDILAAVLPTALITQKRFPLIVDTLAKRIFFCCTSSKQAEVMASTLREAVGSLPVRHLSTRLNVTQTLTEWVKAEEAPGNLRLLDAAMMEEFEEGQKAAVAHIELTDEGVQILLQGRVITRLALGVVNEEGSLLCAAMIDKTLQLRKVYFSDVADAEVDQRIHGTDKDDADYNRLAMEAGYIIGLDALNQLLDALVENMGGEDHVQI